MADGTVLIETSLDTTGFSTGLGKLKSVAAKGFSVVTSAVAAVTTGLVALGGAAVKVGSDFESQMSTVESLSNASAQTVTTASGEIVNGFDAVKKKAEEIGATTSLSATESAQALEYMALAGWDAQEMYDGLAGVASLAAASGEDLANVSDILTDAITAFGDSAADATRYANVLAQTAAASNTDVGTLGYSFKYTAAMAGVLGYSVEDVSAALGLMANAGIKGTSSGTALNMVLTRLSTNTGGARDQLEELGIAFFNEDGSARDLNEVLVELCDATADMTDEQKTNIAHTIAGTQAQKGLLAIMNQGSAAYEEMRDLLYASNDAFDGMGAAAHMAAVRLDNLQGQVTLLQSAAESLGIAVYEELQQPLMDLAYKGQEYISMLYNAFQDAGFAGLAQEIGYVLADAAVYIAQQVPMFMQTAQSVIHAFCNGLLENKDEVSQAALNVVSSIASTIMLSGATIGATAVELIASLAAGLAEQAPVLLDSAGEAVGTFADALIEYAPSLGASTASLVATIGEYIVEHIPDMIETGKQIVQGFCDGISEEFPGVGALLEGLFAGLSDTLGRAAQGVTDLLSGIFDFVDGCDPAAMEAIGTAIGTIAGALISLNVAKGAISSLSGVFSILQTAGSGIGTVTSVVGKLVEGFQLLAGGAGTFTEVLALEFPKLGAIATTIQSAFSTVVSAVGSFVSTFGTVIAGIGALVGGAVLAVTNFVSMFQNGFSAAKEALMVLGVAIAAVGAVILGAPAVVAAVVAGIVTTIATLAVVIKEHWNEIVAFFQGIPDAISSVIDSIGTFFAGIGESIATFASNVATGIGNGIAAAVQFFSELPEKAASFLSMVIDAVLTWGNSLLTSAQAVAGAAADAIVQFFSDLPYKIGFAIGYVIGTVISWGVSLLSAIQTVVPQVINAICTFFSELPGKIQLFLSNVITNVLTWGSNMLLNAQTAAQNTINAIVTFFSELPGKIQAVFTDVITKATTWATNIASKAKTAATNFLNNVSNTIKSLPSKVQSFLTSTITKVTSWASSMAAKAKTAAASFLNNIVNTITSLPGKIQAQLSNALAKVTTWGTNLAAKGKAAISTMLSSIVSAASSIPSKMMSIGQNIVNGVWNGIKKAKDAFVKNVKSFFSGIVDGAKSALGINSPSRVFRDEVGHWIPEGIAVGIEKSSDSAIDSVSKLSADLVDKASGKAVFAVTSSIDLPDLSGYANQLQAAAEMQIGSVGARISAKANGGSSIEAALDSEKFDYDKFGAKVAKGISDAGIDVKLQGRPVGRILATT